MKVFCAYSSEFDKFINQLVPYVIDKYKDDLDLRNIKEIELVKQIPYLKDSDGRCEKNRILVAERLYKKLPSLEMIQLEGNETFMEIVGTLYHEMGHATDEVKMPKMYYFVRKSENINPESMSVYLFLEYIAERRTSFVHPREHDQYCEQISSGMWNVYGQKESEFAFYYLSKLMVYYIIRKHGNDVFTVDDSLFKEYEKDLENSFAAVYSKLPFDDPNMCLEIARTMRKYMPLFESKYSKKRYSN